MPAGTTRKKTLQQALSKPNIAQYIAQYITKDKQQADAIQHVTHASETRGTQQHTHAPQSQAVLLEPARRASPRPHRAARQLLD
jgi:hypothetical protein